MGNKNVIKKYQRKFKDFINYWKIFLRYIKVKNRIKKSVKNGEKIKVLFLATEDCKWNYDSVYVKLKSNQLFEPLIVLSPRTKIERQEKKDIIKNYNFFKKKYKDIYWGYDIDTNRYISLKHFNPDIVFYTQPWEIHKLHNIKKVSSYALTCYCPYPLAESPETLVVNLKKFHINLWKHFIIANEVKKQYKEELNYASKNIVVTGNPKLDVYMNLNKKNSKNYVIYAPHCSFPKFSWSKCATFEWNGLHILEYAKRHPEFNWVFKPHPDVYRNLICNKIMSKDEVDSYYSEWKNIGIYYDTGDYYSIFQNSKCLITDCISFLGEYFPTRKPVIHLRSKFTVNYMALNQEIIRHYYQAWDLDELDMHLKNILEDNKDPMKAERVECLEKMRLGKISAADNIIENIKKSLGV